MINNMSNGIAQQPALDIEQQWLQRADDHGLEAAFIDLLEQVTLEASAQAVITQSRFYRKVPASEAHPARLVPVDCEIVAETFAAGNGWKQFLWLDDHFNLHAVTCDADSGISHAALDDFYWNNPTLLHRWTHNLTAGGHIVGCVTFADI